LEKRSKKLLFSAARQGRWMATPMRRSKNYLSVEDESVAPAPVAVESLPDGEFSPVAFMAPAEALVEPSAVTPVFCVPLETPADVPTPTVVPAAGEPVRAVSDVPLADEAPAEVCAIARPGPAAISATAAAKIILRIKILHR
jgi:hypothetical protein